MLDKGTPTLSRQQVQDRLDALRTELRFGFSEPGALSVASLQSRREHLPAAIALVGALLREPAFDAEVLEEVERQALTAHRVAAQGARRGARERARPPRQPVPARRHPPRAQLRRAVADVKAVTASRCATFHARFSAPAHAEFAAVGDFDAAAVRTALERASVAGRAPRAYARVPTPLVAGRRRA